MCKSLRKVICWRRQIKRICSSNAPSMLWCRPNAPSMLWCSSNAPSMLWCRPNAPSMLWCRPNAPSMLWCRPNAPSMLWCRPNAPSMLWCRPNAPSMLWCRPNAPSMLWCRPNAPLSFPNYRSTNKHYFSPPIHRPRGRSHFYKRDKVVTGLPSPTRHGTAFCDTTRHDTNHSVNRQHLSPEQTVFNLSRLCLFLSTVPLSWNRGHSLLAIKSSVHPHLFDRTWPTYPRPT